MPKACHKIRNCKTKKKNINKKIEQIKQFVDAINVNVRGHVKNMSLNHLRYFVNSVFLRFLETLLDLRLKCS